MKRHALLIDAGKARDETELPGCTRDVERLSAWLHSGVGGAWEPEEIAVLHNPSRWELTTAVSKGFVAVDFGLLAFSGHGEIEEDWSGKRTQKVVAGDGQELDFATLSPAAPKSIIICDTCRKIKRPVRFERRQKAMAFSEGYSSRFSRLVFRERFRLAVENAPAGRFTMYGCSPGQTAGDDALNGGFFTDSLLTVAAAWCEDNTGSGVLTIDKAFELARGHMVQSNLDQVPVGTPSDRSRNGNPFPFAIRLS
jgi:hypothetical protein